MGNALLITGIVVALFIGAKLLLVRQGSAMFPPEKPFFNIARFTAQEIYRYLPSVLIQGYIARSIMQEGFIYVFGERYGMLSILVSSLIFGVVHLPYSFVTMVGASVLLGALGLFYQKNRNLAAVSVIHYVVSEAAMILGFL